MSVCCSAFELEGSPTSYAQFPAWRPSGPAHPAQLSFQFRTDTAGTAGAAGAAGLLVYSDCDQLEVKLVPGGGVRARLGGSVLEVGGAGAGAWHEVRLEVTSTNLSLSLDNTHRHTLPCPASQQQQLSSAASHQYVYVGGLPSWYSTKLQVGHLPCVYYP